MIRDAAIAPGMHGWPIFVAGGWSVPNLLKFQIQCRRAIQNYAALIPVCQIRSWAYARFAYASGL